MIVVESVDKIITCPISRDIVRDAHNNFFDMRAIKTTAA